MMNVIEVQDALKGMPMEQLIREVQMPSGQVPQFLVLSEITRRREMEKAYAQNQGQPQTTVAQDAVTGAGVPQGGIAGIARAMAPNTDMTQNTGVMPQAPVQQMASGGYVQKMQRGGIADLERAQRNVERSTSARVGTRTSNPRIMQIANMFGITVEDAQRMIENAPELLDILAPPSAMITAPGVSARPITPVDPRVLPAGYVPEFSRIGRNDEPAMPGPIPVPVGGSTTAEQPRIETDQANDPRRIRELMDLAVAERAFQRTDNFPGEYATTPTGRLVRREVPPFVAPMPTATAYGEPQDIAQLTAPAPIMLGAPSAPQLAELTPPAIAAAPQDVPRALTGAQNLPLAVGLGDTTRGQEAAAAMFDVTEAERRRREAEVLAAAARREMLPFTSAFDPVVSTYTGEEGQYPRDPSFIYPEAPLPEAAVGTAGLERPAYDLGGRDDGGIGTTLRRIQDTLYRAGRVEPEAEVLEGGTTPAGGPPVAPPLPPGRGIVTPPAPPAPPAGGGAGAGIAGAMSPFESEIANLLQQREKRAEQDKWLALAQVGLSLMGSRQPTFAGALGEAGAAGLKQFQEGRAQYDKDRLELLALQESTRLNRAKLAAAGRGGGLTPYQAATLARQMRSDAAGELNTLMELRKGLEDPMGNPPTDERLAQWEALTAQINNLMGELYGVGGGDTGGEDFATSAARAG